ncbi:hypothetical protein C8Q80DRAFT_1276033 [Daedaleopsis nitida]|nr:hypothetical protein C8Q80DRAFT_1276033 [Daedaleopsis nitida]
MEEHGYSIECVSTMVQPDGIDNPGTGGKELCPGYALALSQYCESSVSQDKTIQHALVQFRGYESESDDGDARDVFDDIFGKPQSRSAIQAVAQLASHVTRAYNHQPSRLALYVFFVARRAFRVTRWDRSGVIVTPAVDSVDRPTPVRLPMGLQALLSPSDPEYYERNAAARALESDISQDEGTFFELEESHDRPYLFNFQGKMFADSVNAPRRASTSYLSQAKMAIGGSWLASHVLLLLVS